MNSVIDKLAEQAGLHDFVLTAMGVNEEVEKFAELIIEENLRIMQQEWYDLNNAAKIEDESARDIGMRVGKKSEIIRLMSLIKKHFGVEK